MLVGGRRGLLPPNLLPKTIIHYTKLEAKKKRLDLPKFTLAYPTARVYHKNTNNIVLYAATNIK
jgi:hypothetical protein